MLIIHWFISINIWIRIVVSRAFDDAICRQSFGQRSGDLRSFIVNNKLNRLSGAQSRGGVNHRARRLSSYNTLLPKAVASCLQSYVDANNQYRRMAKGQATLPPPDPKHRYVAVAPKCEDLKGPSRWYRRWWCLKTLEKIASLSSALCRLFDAGGRRVCIYIGRGVAHNVLRCQTLRG